MGINIILTGATGMVGEGVLLECLNHPAVDTILCISRRPVQRSHPKLKEYLVPDFLQMQPDAAQLQGYDACFFCAGVSSVGMKEDRYRIMTYDTTLHFAKTVLQQNPDMLFNYVSGRGTDSTEKGRLMWARVKGQTENALLQLPFRKVYLFRPAFMKATPGQQFLPSAYKYLSWLYPVIKTLFPKTVSTLQQVGRAMIRAVLELPDKPVLEVADINTLGTQ